MLEMLIITYILYTFISVFIYTFVKNYKFSNPTIHAEFILAFSFSECLAPFSNSEKPDFHYL